MMTMADVADALKVSEKTVSRMLQEGSIPGFKIANQWRFHRDDFNRWIDEKRNDRSRSARAGLASMLSNETDSVPLSRLTGEDLVVTGIAPGSVESVLKSLAQPLADRGIVTDPDFFLARLMDREAMMSTGVGGGIAIPHLRHPADLPVERPALVVGTVPEGVEWNAFDGQPVRLFLLPVSGDEVVHLKVLSAIRRALVVEGVLDTLIEASTPRELMSGILKIETIQQRG